MTIESLDNVELSESVVSKKSLRVANTNKKTGILDVELVYLKVPDNLTHWISTSDGLKLIEKVKNKKSLIFRNNSRRWNSIIKINWIKK